MTAVRHERCTSRRAPGIVLRALLPFGQCSAMILLLTAFHAN
jgi:hypothetical protein